MYDENALNGVEHPRPKLTVGLQRETLFKKRVKSMGANEMLQKLGDSLGSAATVKSVFGDPIQVDGKIVVPVASVALGFGAGFGAGPVAHHSLAEGQGEGGGGGGGVRAVPAGALEITASRTRFVPFHDTRWLGAAFAAGVLVGGMFVRRRNQMRRQ